MSDTANEQTELEADDQPLTTWQLIVAAQAQRRSAIGARIFPAADTHDGDENDG